MTEERLALSELLEKAGEGDFLRSVAEAVLQLLMETDVEGLIGAGRYERAKAWRDRAASLPEGSPERDACVMLAEGYEKLAALIEARRS